MQRSSPRARAGLEQIGRVHGAFGLARADERVHLVDEEHDLARRVADLLEHGLEAVFELTAELGARDQRAQIEGHEALALQAFGHVSGDDALGEALGDRRSCRRRARR
jgi:hypothetical protein